MKIQSLTQEQIDQFPHYVKKYTDIGISVQPIDFNKAVEVIKEFFGDTLSNRKFVFCESPKGFFNDKKIAVYGNMESYWIANYMFYYENFGICAEINKMIPIIENCSWVAYDDDNVYVSDRPRVIKFDDRNRLHCENGPAIAYSDGFSVYSWHGTRCSKQWIENPKSITVNDCLYHNNVELRRVACEIVGWANVIEKLDYTVVDEDGDPEIGTLLEVDIPDIGKEKFLRVMCGTKREFALAVPPEAKTALEAQAMLFGMSLEEFTAPEIRT